MRVNLQTLGCRLNEAELETWARQFQQLGHQITPDETGADLVVVNTCAVTQEAVRKSRKLLRRAQRDNPRAKLVVSGCFATLETQALALDAGIDLVIPNADKDRLVAITTAELDLPTMPRTALAADANPLFARGRQRAFIKVQDGCRYRCAFCIVTLARGEERSRPIPEVIDEISQAAAAGVREAVLAGVHLGGWGSDLGLGLDDLLRAVLAETDMPRLRLGSLEPWELPDGLWDLFAHPRLMPHLHLPLQSGADSVLRRMARRCRTDEFARLAHEARARVPDINLTTDIIAGFPGETEAEWRQTLDFVSAIGFGQVHIFAYSPRPGTKAASLPDQVPAEVKKARSREMHDLASRMRTATFARYLGQRTTLLLEGPQGSDPDGDRHGYTPHYLPVRLPPTRGQDLTDPLPQVELTAIHPTGDSLVATLAPQCRDDTHGRAAPWPGADSAAP
jgi:threonylcarbamoyladenosine tRNA methylthiotransferase MtaB